MNNKSFWKGLAAGVAGMLVITAGMNYFSSAGILKKDISLDQKVNLIGTMLDKYYVEEVDKEKLEDGIFEGMVSSLGDPYTTYFDQEQLQRFMEDTEGTFDGIGVEITIDPTDMRILVITPILHSPAAEAGILPGDKIIKVDGTDVSGENLNDAVTMMKGKRGTKVTVTIYRESESKTFDVTLERNLITDTSVSYKMLENQIGYIRISQFKKMTFEQFDEAYQDLTKQGQKGLIIDLRNNPGGLFDVSGKIADVLVPEGTYVYTIDKQGNRQDSVSDANCIQVPLCLLVNGNSASASEILSGAVQDMGVGKLVGTQTFGKGLVQALYPLPDGSGLKITIQKYYTPNGVCIQGTGITPDYVVELPEEVKNFLIIDENLDTQLQKAMEVIQSEIK